MKMQKLKYADVETIFYELFTSRSFLDIRDFHA